MTYLYLMSRRETNFSQSIWCSINKLSCPSSPYPLGKYYILEEATMLSLKLKFVWDSHPT